jgi:hypothetical protein
MNPQPSLERQIETLRAALHQADPEASIGYDPISRALQVRSSLDAPAVQRLAETLDMDLGASFAAVDLRQRGSTCCGGCCG